MNNADTNRNAFKFLNDSMCQILCASADGTVYTLMVPPVGEKGIACNAEAARATNGQLIEMNGRTYKLVWTGRNKRANVVPA